MSPNEMNADLSTSSVTSSANPPVYKKKRKKEKKKKEKKKKKKKKKRKKKKTFNTLNIFLLFLNQQSIKVKVILHMIHIVLNIWEGFSS